MLAESGTDSQDESVYVLAGHLQPSEPGMAIVTECERFRFNAKSDSSKTHGQIVREFRTKSGRKQSDGLFEPALGSFESSSADRSLI